MTESILIDTLVKVPDTSTYKINAMKQLRVLKLCYVVYKTVCFCQSFRNSYGATNGHHNNGVNKDAYSSLHAIHQHVFTFHLVLYESGKHHSFSLSYRRVENGSKLFLQITFYPFYQVFYHKCVSSVWHAIIFPPGTSTKQTYRSAKD